MQIIKQADFEFIGRRRIAALFSAVLILAGVVSLIVKGGPAYGIDFAGGTLVHVKFADPIPVQDVRKALAEIGLGRSKIQRFGDSEGEVLIVTERAGGQDVEDAGTVAGDQPSDGAHHDMGTTVTQALRDHLPGKEFETLRVEMVGPQVGSELRRSAFYAIIAAMVGIVAYITFRFEFRFAIAAIVALIHDVMVTIGVFSLTNREIDLPIVAALLTIVGYSLNDTIVVFDRIRDNLRLLRRMEYDRLLNTSINQTLSRTLLTSLTTLVVVLALLFFGGEVIHGFAFALMVGVLVGTYSSIFVASPLLVVWKQWDAKRKPPGPKGKGRK